MKIKCLNKAGHGKPPTKNIQAAADRVMRNCDMNDPILQEFVGLVLRKFKGGYPERAAVINRFSWVLQAVSNDRLNSNMALPWAHDGWLVATDGRRVHRWKNGIEDGWYKRSGDPTTSEYTAPIYGHLIPVLEPCREVTLADFKNVKYDLVSYSEGTFFESQILQAFAGHDIMHAPVHLEDKSSTLLLESIDGDQQAIIMPLRV